MIAWLEQQRNVNAANPFFLWVHCWDPHTPYQPPADSAARFYSGDPKSRDLPQLRDHPSIRKHKWLKDVTDPDYPQAMYRAEIHEMDRQIGRLLDYLDETGLRHSTGIVVVGDHGENLGEHDQFFNHYFIFEQTLRVPLIMRFQGYPRGLRVEQQVCQLDIVPTIAKIYGLTLGHELQGLSLLRTLEGQPDPALAKRVVFVHEHGKNRQIAVRDHDYKIVYTIETTDRPPLLARRGDVWLFDLARDPGERHNLAADHPELVKKYRPFIRPWMALGLQRGDEAKPLTDPQRDHLRSLGYLDEQEDNTPAERKKGPDGK